MSSKYSRKKQEKPNETVPVLQLFQFASKIDILVILIATVTSIVSGAIQPLSIIFFGDVLKKMGEAIMNRKDIVGEAMPVVKIYVYLGIGVMAAAYISNCLWILAGESQTRRIRQLYVHSILRQEMSWFDKADEGSLSTRLAADIVLVQEGISEKFGQAVMGISQFIAGIVVAFYKGWKLAIVMSAVAPIIVLAGAAMGYSVSKYTVLAQNAYAEAGAVAEQVFAGIRTVYSFSLQKRFSKTYDQKLVGAEEAGIKRGKVLGAGLGIFLFSVMGMYGLSFWYGARMVRDHKMDGSTVLVVFLSMVMGELSLMNVPNHLAAISAASAAAFKIFQTIHRVPSIDTATFQGKRPLKITGDIEFSNVRFCYPTRPDTIILKNLNLKIKAGMTVAFVGPSGSGKSTSVALIQRFYDPLSGTVTLDGVNLKEYNVKILREHIGVVSQEPVLFNTSIKENIMMGSPERNIGIKEIIAVCKKANCHNFIKQLPYGYDTLVGEHGGMLSGGQKQRIAIARAILKNPAILLLDEATSALDTQSERLVQAALDEASADRTTIIVAHRLSTVRNADLIVVMDKGDLVEQGTHNELLALNGVYSELVRKQKIETVDESDNSSSSEQDEKEALLQHEALAVNRLSALSATDSDTSSDFSSIINFRQSARHTNYSNMDGHEAKRRREIQDKLEAKKMKAPVTRVLKDMREHWGSLLLGILGAMLAGVAFPLYSLFFSQIVTILIDNDDRYYGPLEGPNRYAFLFFILGLMALIGFYLEVASFEYAGAKYTTLLRSRLFAAYIKQEIGFFDRDENSVGSLTAKLATECKNVNELITKVWGDFAHASVTVFAGLAIAFAYSWRLTLIVMCMTPIIAFATGWQQKIQREFEDNTKDNGNSTAEVANEAIKQIRTVTALNKQLHFEEKYYKATEEIHEMSKRRAYLSSIGFALLQSSSLFANAIGFFAGAKLIVKEQLIFRDMIIALTSVIILSESLGRSSVLITTYAKAKIAAISVYQLLDRKSSIDPELEGIEPSDDDIDGAINFSDIKFRYPARPDVPIFNGKFNLKGKAGQTIALVGPSGCGKSTTIGMLQRWYDPLKGTVRVDNHNVKSFSLKNLRSHMALVGQEPVLFDVSIGDNIRFGVDNPESVTLDQIKEVCRAANIHTFIKGLPDGYNTRVGDKGSQLSGGQKQRIAIARALLRKPKILLLDEATSALDSESEKLVQQALDKILEQGGRTTITIAHRLSTITNSDLICVIKDSRVIEQGTHWELLKLNGVYTELVNQQSLTTT